MFVDGAEEDINVLVLLFVDFGDLGRFGLLCESQGVAVVVALSRCVGFDCTQVFSLRSQIEGIGLLVVEGLVFGVEAGPCSLARVAIVVCEYGRGGRLAVQEVGIVK